MEKNKIKDSVSLKRLISFISGSLITTCMIFTMSCESSDGDSKPPSACSQTIEERTVALENTGTDISAWSIEDASEMGGLANEDTNKITPSIGRYRDYLANHLGCMTRSEYTATTGFYNQANTAAVAAGQEASIAGYDCAAKEYTVTNPDTDKPIVILVHGTTASPNSWEEYGSSTSGTIRSLGGVEFTKDTTVRTMLATRLVERGFQTYAVDFRTDQVFAQEGFVVSLTNGGGNIDHGWGVPIIQSLLESIMKANPDRKISVVAHSYGVMATRDALRRLYNRYKLGASGAVNPFVKIQDLIWASGVNHGTSFGNLCTGEGDFPNGIAEVRGRTPADRGNMGHSVTCEMGDRMNFRPTYFTQPVNGPQDLFTAPCADGDYAFGEKGQCGDNVIEYTTITMRDKVDGSFQDEFVSEASAGLSLEGCVDNQLTELTDLDTSGHYSTSALTGTTFEGTTANHFGSIRSERGMELIIQKLED